MADILHEEDTSVGEEALSYGDALLLAARHTAQEVVADRGVCAVAQLQQLDHVLHCTGQT
jgi:hypothetical protein